MTTTEQERENLKAGIVKNKKYEAERRQKIQTGNQQNKNIFKKLPIFENRAPCLADNGIQCYRKSCFEISGDRRHINTHEYHGYNRSKNGLFVSHKNFVKMPINNQ